MESIAYDVASIKSTLTLIRKPEHQTVREEIRVNVCPACIGAGRYRLSMRLQGVQQSWPRDIGTVTAKEATAIRNKQDAVLFKVPHVIV